MKRSDRCARLAAEIGWSEAAKQVYPEQFDSRAKEYARRLFALGFGVLEISTLCKLKYGIGALSTVSAWTNPEVYKKALKRRCEWAKKKRGS